MEDSLVELALKVEFELTDAVPDTRELLGKADNPLVGLALGVGLMLRTEEELVRVLELDNESELLLAVMVGKAVNEVAFDGTGNEKLKLLETVKAEDELLGTSKDEELLLLLENVMTGEAMEELPDNTEEVDEAMELLEEEGQASVYEEPIPSLLRTSFIQYA